jgi:acetoin utilization deacetylase AcuC-like enzyme
MKTGIIFDEKYIEHKLSIGHLESPERLIETMEILKKILDKPDIKLLKPKSATKEALLRVHEKQYIDDIMTMSKNGNTLSLDTPIPRGTYEIAKLSAGGAILAGDLVCKKEFDNAFALTRPPGHHAGKSFGGGFCFFNNMAIMIEHLREKQNIKKIAILDWDVHHGNGTQDIFYEDPNVFFFSTHQSPLYPGTGKITEIGEEEGKGYNINIPLDYGTSGKSFLFLLKNLFEPIVKQFKPDMIAVSAGYDAYFDDPLAGLNFTVNTYAQATSLLKNLSNKICDDKIVFLLEGGYNLKGLSNAILATISTLNGNTIINEPIPPPQQKIDEFTKNQIKKIKEILSDYWSFQYLNQ